MEVKCPDCGGELIRKSGVNGAFLGCRRWPDCRGSRELDAPDVKAASGESKESSFPEKKEIPQTGIENNGTFLSELLGEIRSLRISVDRLTDAVRLEGANNDLNLLRHAAMTIADEMRIHNQFQWLMWETTYGRKPKGDA